MKHKRLYKEKFKFPDRPPQSRPTRKAVAELQEQLGLGKIASNRIKTHRGRKYGEALVLKLAVEHGVRVSTLYDAKKVVETFSEEMLLEAIEHINSTDMQFGISHFVAVSRTKNGAVRLALLNHALDGRWSVRRTQLIVQEANKVFNPTITPIELRDAISEVIGKFPK